MATMNGGSEVVDLGDNFRLIAPGFQGTAVAHDARPHGVRDRGIEIATTALDEALEATGMEEIRSIVLEGTHVAVARDESARTMSGEPALILDVPDLGPEVGQVVMAVDEDGAITWNYPVASQRAFDAPTSRDTTPVKTFVIRSTSPSQVPGDAPSDRSLLQGIGKKILKVIKFPVAGTALQTAARFFARKWEEKNRPYGMRWFGPDDYRSRIGTPIEGDDWGRLGSGRALLFVHGTFSTAYSGFYGVPPQTMGSLSDMYDGRIFAFDHFTLSHDPQRNLVEFLDKLPSSLELDIDVIAHSRGGLVARALSGETSIGTIPQISVNKAVLVGVPNHGTALADARHMTDFVDRHTSILNLIPEGPASVVVEVLEAIITAVKMIGSSALAGLPGLLSMDPSGVFLTEMNQGSPASTEYFAVAADYEPTGGLKDLVEDGLADRVFLDAANDLVVPTVGVFSGSADPAFPISRERILEFPPEKGIAHNRFFSQPETGQALIEWLS